MTHGTERPSPQVVFAGQSGLDRESQSRKIRSGSVELRLASGVECDQPVTNPVRQSAERSAVFAAQVVSEEGFEPSPGATRTRPST